MILSKVSISRPVFATMMILALVVLGIYSYLGLSVELFPDVDFPIVVVTVTYPGATPENMETEVMKKIEDAVNPLSGVRHIETKCLESYAYSVVTFEMGKSGDICSQEVREKVAGIQKDLPDDIEDVVIQKYDPKAMPIVSIAVAGNRSARELTFIAKETVKKRLESLQGVGNVELIGGEEREILVELDLASLEALNLSIFEVQNRLASASLDLPGGTIKREGRDFTVRTLGKITSLDQIGDLVVKNQGGREVLMRDIAVIKDTTKELESISRLNGKRAVALNIVKQSGANTVDVAKRVKAKIQELSPLLPSGVQLIVASDNSIFTVDAIDDVMTNILYGSLLAVLVIFLFLADSRPTLISAAAIPTSIIATFIFMKALGFTLNFMTLLGLSLAVGLLIDDAIVVIENVYRHKSMGKPSDVAANDGTSEIGLAVLATTFSLVVVFVPVSFMQGIVGRFFFSFGMTVAVAVLVSLFVAFTLTPMLSSRFLREEHAHHVGTKNPIYMLTNTWNNMFDRLNVLYQSLVRSALRHRALTIIIAVVAFVGSFFVVPLIGTEFLPQYDQGQFWISFKAGPGTTLEETARLAEEVEKTIGTHKEVRTQFTTIGSGSDPDSRGSIAVKLVDLSERETSVFTLIEQLRKELSGLVGLRLTISIEESHGGGGGNAVEIAVSGDNQQKLMALAEEVEDSVRATPGAVETDNSLGEGKPELQLELDRGRISDLGLNVAQISLAVRYLVNGVVPMKYREGDFESDVRLRLRESDRKNISDLSRILIPSGKDIPGKDNFQVPLNYVAKFRDASSVSEINRFDRQKTVKVTANNVNRFAGDVRSDAIARSAKIPTPPGYRIYQTGEAEYQAEAFTAILSALLLSVILIYIVLASQFESFTDPFAIMLSLPMSLLGAFLGLLFFGSSLSIMSMIGIVMLMGLVTKNAILLVDFAKQKIAGGVERGEALVTAGSVRLRPILMTTFAMIFGMLPLALGIGPGAELRAGIARAVIGGLTTSTILTLVVVPVVYTILDDITRKLFGRRGKPVAKNNSV
jgi:hydrophobe/amphiphile efflux-1 (HAE1) family protein